MGPPTTPPKAARSLTTVIRYDQLNSFYSSPTRYLGNERAWLMDSASGLENTPLRDPRDTGHRGARPDLGRTDPRLSTLRLMYRLIGAARRIVDMRAEDSWGEWFTLDAQDGVRKAFEDHYAKPTFVPGPPLKFYFEDADKRAMRDGRCLLHILLADASGDLAEEPRGVKGVIRFEFVATERVRRTVIDGDPESPTYNQVVAWVLDDGLGGEKPVHAERILPFIPNPKDADHYDGESDLIVGFADAQADENVKYAAAESLLQRITPLLVVEVTDPDLDLSDDAIQAEVKKQVQNLQDPNSQRAYLDGVKVTPLQWGQGTLNPQPYHDMFVQGLATAYGIPKRVLTGDEAGALSASGEDGLRYFGRISKRQEKGPESIVRQYNQRLQKWGLVPQGDFVIEWNPLIEATPSQLAAVEAQLAQARMAYLDRRVVPPANLDWEPSKAKHILQAVTEATRPERVAEVFENPQPESAATRDEASAKRLLVVPPLRPIVRRGTDAIARALRAFEAAYLAIVPAKTKDGFFRSRVKDAKVDPDEADTAAARAQLQRAIEELMREAALEGGQETLSDLQVEAEFRLLDAGPIRALKSLSQRTGADIAETLTTDIRRSLSEGVAAGESLDDLRQRVQAVFDDGRARAMTIAQTESARGFNLGAVEAMRQNGFDSYDIVLLPGACPLCQEAARNGPYPVTRTDVLPVHPHDRCTVSVVPSRGVAA